MSKGLILALIKQKQHPNELKKYDVHVSHMLFNIRTTGNRSDHEWLYVCSGLGHYPSEDNPRHELFVNKNKCCWKVSSSFTNNSSDKKTKCDCLAYLFELCYELLLSEASNASQNPGFEWFTGQNLLSLFVVGNYVFFSLASLKIVLFCPRLPLIYFN